MENMNEDIEKALEERAKLMEALLGEGLEITFPSEKIEDAPINYDGFENLSAEGKKILDNVVAFCKKYLRGVIIKDKFGSDDPARTKKRFELAEKYGEAFSVLYDSNKLKVNAILSLYIISNLVLELDMQNIHTAQAESARLLADKLPTSLSWFNYLPIDEKMEVVSKMENIARDFLSIIIKK